MKEGYIAVLDSGIGGLSVLSELIKIIPNAKYLYFGDNSNAPYGNRSVTDLRRLTEKNLDYLKHYNISVLVVGCNTLSLNLLPFISEYSGLPTFGIFPPVEKYLMEGERVLLLSTTRSAERFTASKNFHVVGLKNLVFDIENNLFNLSNVNIEKNLRESTGNYVDLKGYYDRVILGCTHYEFIKKEIINHFCPQNCSSGAIFTALRVKEYLKSIKLLVKHNDFDVMFVGKNADYNKNFWVLGGQKV